MRWVRLLTREKTNQVWQQPGTRAVTFECITAPSCAVGLTCTGLRLQNGRIEYIWLLRHKDPSLCTVGSTFLWLFARFQGLESP